MSQVEDKRFEFGSNWYDYVQKNFDREKVDISRRHILKFTGLESMDGLTVLDIGCGSGLHSLAMLDAKAQKVSSFDYDPNSVRASELIKGQVGSPSNWNIEQGSILDDTYVARLPLYDLVYSWGVCITRAMSGMPSAMLLAGSSRAGASTSRSILPMFRSIRHPSSGWPSSASTSMPPPLRRRAMEAWYVWRFELGRNPLRLPFFLHKIMQYKKNRGMNVMADIRDWLGGWPMEFVFDKDAIAFVEKLGFKLECLASRGTPIDQRDAGSMAPHAPGASTTGFLWADPLRASV